MKKEKILVDVNELTDYIEKATMYDYYTYAGVDNWAGGSVAYEIFNSATGFEEYEEYAEEVIQKLREENKGE